MPRLRTRPAEAQQTGGLHPASEGTQKRVSTAEECGRWYQTTGLLPPSTLIAVPVT